MSLPDGIELTANTYSNTEEGSEADYRVREEVPPEESASAYRTDEPSHDFDLLAVVGMRAGGTSERCLRVDLDRVKVHHIVAVSFTTEAHSVRRYRWTKGATPF
jgi:hypothetical protein